MICKNCSAEYDDKLEACPECGEKAGESPAEESESTAVPSPEEDKEAAKIEESAAEEETKSEEEADSADTEPEVKAEEKIAEEKTAEENSSEKPEAKMSVKPVVKARRASAMPESAVSREKMIKDNKARKRASTLIIVIMCVIAVLAVALSVLNITTDIFDNDGASEKVVAGIGFTPQEEKDFEAVVAKTFSVAKEQYNKAGTTAEAFLERIIPGDTGNVYSVINGVNEPVQTEPDPADRFSDENGSYAYYKLEESRVDKVLKLFGLESYRGENCKDYYYCNGYYYFAAGESGTTPVVSAEVVKSRRVIDGSYYVEGYFFAEKQGEIVKTDNCHFVVEMTKDSETGESVYVIKRVSAEPIFGGDGNILDGAENAEREKKVIEGYTDDGKLFCVYTLDFPVLETKGAGYNSLNEFFKNAVSVYELKAEAAQQAYEDFVKSGGDESKLPLAENVVASVVFEDEKNLSFKEVISQYTPLAGADTTYIRSIEAHTFDRSTGDFVSKDDVLGKNYLAIGEVLYRIHEGYEYESLLPKEKEEEQESTYDEVPADREGLGAKIYESAWSYTEEGVTFYYIGDKGYVTEVTIPFAAAEKLKK